jgi:hypothetical protein
MQSVAVLQEMRRVAPAVGKPLRRVTWCGADVEAFRFYGVQTLLESLRPALPKVYDILLGAVGSCNGIAGNSAPVLQTWNAARLGDTVMLHNLSNAIKLNLQTGTVIGRADDTLCVRLTLSSVPVRVRPQYCVILAAAPDTVFASKCGGQWQMHSNTLPIIRLKIGMQICYAHSSQTESDVLLHYVTIVQRRWRALRRRGAASSTPRLKR